MFLDSFQTYINSLYLVVEHITHV